HPFPSRTRKLSPSSPRVLHGSLCGGGGRGRRQFRRRRPRGEVRFDRREPKRPSGGSFATAPATSRPPLPRAPPAPRPIRVCAGRERRGGPPRRFSGGPRVLRAEMALAEGEEIGPAFLAVGPNAFPEVPGLDPPEVVVLPGVVAGDGPGRLQGSHSPPRKAP